MLCACVYACLHVCRPTCVCSCICRYMNFKAWGWRWLPSLIPLHLVPRGIVSQFRTHWLGLSAYSGTSLSLLPVCYHRRITKPTWHLPGCLGSEHWSLQLCTNCLTHWSISPLSTFFKGRKQILRGSGLVLRYTHSCRARILIRSSDASLHFNLVVFGSWVETGRGCSDVLYLFNLEDGKMGSSSRDTMWESSADNILPQTLGKDLNTGINVRSPSSLPHDTYRAHCDL